MLVFHQGWYCSFRTRGETFKQRNYLPLTTLQIGKRIETDAKEIANYFNGYFNSIAGKLNGKIVKSKNMNLSYLGSMKENNVFNTNNTSWYLNPNRQCEGK